MKKTVLLSFFLILFIRGLAQEVNHWEMIIEASDTWSYILGSAEPPVTWTDPEFDPSSWLTGPGGIGYGDNDDQTIISPTISLYMRRDFTVTDPTLLSWLVLHVDFDDSFVAYLNGVEIARANIGTVGTRPLYNQTATVDTYEAQMYQGRLPARFIINKDSVAKYLRSGKNTLALQVHNYSIGSSDLSSTTYLNAGIRNTSVLYRNPPAWFNDPFLETSMLPLIVIDTWGATIPDEPKITAWMKVIDNGPGIPNSFMDSGTDFDGYVGIEVRGQSSQSFPKKSFGFEIRDNLGVGVDSSLLGMPAEEDWILYAPYSDKSLLRNAISYELGQALSNWQPRYRFCEVYLNGSYHGIYMLVEKIKRDNDRVDINKLNPDEIAGDNLTGGYIVKVDKTWDLTTAEYFRTYPTYRYYNARNYDFTYVYPDFDELVPQQKSYIQTYLLDLENALNGPSFTDQTNGFRKFIDVESFAEFQVINELANNVDGYRYSTYFHKRRDSDGGKLVAGPLWDFDLSYGNVDYSPSNLATEGWLYTHWGPTAGNPMHWWARLMEDPGYRDSFSTSWWELRKTKLHTDSLFRFIDNTVLYLGEAVTRNFTKWPILGVDIWPNYYVGTTHASEITYLKSWLNNRILWLDANIPKPIVVEDTTSPFKGLNIYPNPASDRFSVAMQTSSFEVVDIVITDITGRTFHRKRYYPSESGEQKVDISLPELSTGVYIVRVTQDGRVVGTGRVLIGLRE